MVAKSKTAVPSSRSCRFGARLLLIGCVIILAGCSMASYGRFKQSGEVEKIFKSGRVLMDHEYYYSGSITRPDAVMGIQKGYALEDEYWSKADEIQKYLKFWVEQMSRDWLVKGYGILAPDGKQLGIYFSRWNNGPIIMQENNRVEVYLPDKEGDRLWRRGPDNE